MPETWNLTTDKNQRIIRRERVIFDFPKLYHALKAWAKPHQYELVEKAFEEKVKSTGKQYVIQLEYARKFTEFVKSEISVEIVIKDMMDVMLQDNPHTLNKGNIELVITSKMIMDYKDNFQKSPFLKALRKIYIYYITKPNMLSMAGDIAGFHESLIEVVKKHFNFYNPE